VFIVEQRYIKYRTFTFTLYLYGVLFSVERSGFIGQQRLRAVFLAMRVPVELDLLRALIQA